MITIASRRLGEKGVEKKRTFDCIEKCDQWCMKRSIIFLQEVKVVGDDRFSCGAA